MSTVSKRWMVDGYVLEIRRMDNGDIYPTVNGSLMEEMFGKEFHGINQLQAMMETELKANKEKYATGNVGKA